MTRNDKDTRDQLKMQQAVFNWFSDGVLSSMHYHKLSHVNKHVHCMYIYYSKVGCKTNFSSNEPTLRQLMMLQAYEGPIKLSKNSSPPNDLDK